MSDDSTNPQDSTTDAVVPPPPAETPIPEGLLSPPPPAETPIPEGLLSPPSSAGSTADAVAPADAVIPPPPPEAMVPATRRSRPKPAVLAEDAPSAVADDWAAPSVAPETPSSGSYRVLSGVIFAFLVLLLVAAVATGVYLLTNMPITFGSGAGIALAPAGVLAPI